LQQLTLIGTGIDIDKLVGRNEVLKASEIEKVVEGTWSKSLSLSGVEKLKVDELRRELRKRGKSVTGNKKELRDKLAKAIQDRTPIVQEQTVSAASTGFAEGAKWKLIVGTQIVVPPSNEDPTLVAPTEARESVDGVIAGATKLNYVENFKRSTFTGATLVPVRDEITQKVIYPIEYEVETTAKVTPKFKWIKKHKLTVDSPPPDWFRAFLPNTAPKNNRDGFCTDKWCTYTNMKARMDFAGMPERNGTSRAWKDFTPKEIEQHLALYLVQGLNTSSSVFTKLKDPSEDPINGKFFV